MKWIDLPPVWLIAMLVLAWGMHWLMPGLTFGAWSIQVGMLLVLGGLLLTGLAAVEFLRARTSIVPGNTPTTLISGGIFRYSRNPIYLADVMFLAGFILWSGAVLALPLLVLFVWILRRRFILPEEARMQMAFPSTFAAYKSGTRRWL